jgi:hypothetical protein
MKTLSRLAIGSLCAFALTSAIGSWKNGKSTYEPLWVKTSQTRFTLIPNEQGEILGTLTIFSDANRDADSRAYAALMRHLREVGGKQSPPPARRNTTSRCS